MFTEHVQTGAGNLTVPVYDLQHHLVYIRCTASHRALWSVRPDGRFLFRRWINLLSLCCCGTAL